MQDINPLDTNYSVVSIQIAVTFLKKSQAVYEMFCRRIAHSMKDFYYVILLLCPEKETLRVVVIFSLLC